MKTAPILGLSISLFMMNLDTSIVSVGVPSMISDFHSSFGVGQWFMLIYLLVLTALIACAGRLGDMIGKKKLYLAGILVFTLASLLCGLAHGAVAFILFRGLQGIGAAFILSLSTAIATEITPKEQLGRMMGILSTVTALGIAGGPTVGGLLLSVFGWRSMFLANIPCGVVAFCLLWSFDSKPITRKNVRIDWIGMILLAASLCCYCIVMTSIGQGGAHRSDVWLSALAVLGFFAFIRVEKRQVHPLLNLELFKNRLITRNLAVTVLVYTVIITTVILPPFYLSKAAGYTPLQIGLLMSFGPLLTVAFSIYAGKIADKYGAGKVMFYAVVTIGVGCLCMATISPDQGMIGYLWRVAIIQLGLTFFKTPNNTIVMEVAQADQRGLLSGLLSLARIAGQITGTALMGVIFAVLSGVAVAGGHNATSRSVTYGFDSVFFINLIVALLAAILVFPGAFKYTYR